MSTTLPLFWHLSSASQEDRIDASVKLVASLEQFQLQFVPKGSPETSDEEDEEDGTKTDGLDMLNAQDVSYSIRRLVRGLASPRESSRLGFAVALTELLSRVDTVACSQIVSIILDSSKIQGSMTGQEERDLLFARLFGLTSVIQSGLLVRQTPLPTSASTAALASSLSAYSETLSQLLLVGEKKSWLRESAWWTASLALDALAASEVAWKDEAVETTVQSIFVDNKIWTPEKVALALKMQISNPERDWQKYVSPTFKHPELLSIGNLTTLARILKEAGLEDEDGSKSAPGNWKPQIHFAWDIILDQLLSIPKSANSSQASFQEFFRVVVDESLFSSSSSPERKYWGFQIFEKALPRVSADDMPMLFTKNFMRSWINHLSNKDRYLHKAARQVAICIQTVVQKSPTLGFTLILQLTGSNGNRQFDKLTKTKTVESILASMDAQGIETYIEFLLGQVNETEKDDIRGVNARRAWIVDQLGALIRNGSIPKNDQWIQSILDWLIINGLFVIRKKSDKSSYRALRTIPVPAFSDDLRQNCRLRLLNCLADLTSHITLVKSDDGKAQKLAGVAADGEFWISKALATIALLEKDTKHLTLLEEADEEDLAIRLKAQQLVQTLKDVPADRQEMAKGAELLLMATVMQQYGADESRSANGLEACIGAIDRMFASGKKNKKSRKSTGDLDAEAVSEPIDILVDSIIGFLEQSTAYLRTVANQIFSLLSGAIQDTTVDLILTQLERRNPAELAMDGDEEMEETEWDNDDDEETEDEDEDDDDDDLSENENDENVQALRRKIEEALKVNGVEAATGDSDEETDEEPMNDDQMMAIDEQLVEVFRSQMNNKKTSKDVDAQREATHFKNRVLDLVDIFVKKQPTSRHIVRLILPLVDIIAGTGSDEQQLSDKATSLLRNRIGRSKDTPSDIGPEELLTVLSEIHGRARRARSSEVLTTLSQCSLYLSKILLQSGAEASVLPVYRTSLVDFVTRKASTLNATFFQDFIRRYPSIGWDLRSDIVTVSSQATNVYRQCQAFQLLQVVTNQIPALHDQEQEVLTFMPTLQVAIVDLIGKACDEELVLTTPQMKDLFKLGVAAVRQTQRVASSQGALSSIWKPKSWDILHKKLLSCERFKASTALQSACQQITQLLQGTLVAKESKVAKGKHAVKSPVTAPKRKADTNEDDEDALTARKAKRKKVRKTKA